MADCSRAHVSLNRCLNYLFGGFVVLSYHACLMYPLFLSRYHMLFILIMHQCEGRIGHLYLSTYSLLLGKTAPSIMLHSRVIKVEDHNILRAHAHELIHYIGHLGSFHHRADCDPSSGF